jgi:hypothetical protein
MELRSWVWLINSRCLCSSQLHSHLRIQRAVRETDGGQEEERNDLEGGRDIAFITLDHNDW